MLAFARVRSTPVLFSKHLCSSRSFGSAISDSNMVFSLNRSGYIWNHETDTWSEGDFDAYSLADKNGVYETMILVDGHARELEAHAERFFRGCEILGFSTTPGPNPPPMDVVDLSGKWTMRWYKWIESDGIERIAASMFSGTLQPTGGASVLVGLVSDKHVPPPPHPDVKHLCLFKRQAMRDKLQRAFGWNDYLVVHTLDNVILEGSNWSFMALIDGKWKTPAVRQGLLRGTRISELLSAGEYDGYPVVEGDVTVSELRSAERLAGPSSSGIRTLELAEGAEANIQ